MAQTLIYGDIVIAKTSYKNNKGKSGKITLIGKLDGRKRYCVEFDDDSIEWFSNKDLTLTPSTHNK